MKKVLIIGGTGNISTGITKALSAEGYDVTLFNRNETKTSSKDYRVIQGDRHDREMFVHRLRQTHFDYAIDMICFDRKDAEDDFAALYDVGHFIMCSTGAVYGVLPPHYTPIPEDAPRNPSWSYGIGKKNAEDFFLEKFSDCRFPVTIIRPTFTYGRQKLFFRQFLFDNSWIDRIKKGKPILTGNPYLLRNFLHVDDAAAAFTGALGNPKCLGQAYNMVGLRPHSWQEFHLAMMHAVGREVEMIEAPYSLLASYHLPNFESYRENWRYNGFYCGDKIARDIPSFHVSVSLEEGIRRTLAFLEDGDHIPNSDLPEYAWEDEIIYRLNSIHM